MNSELARDAGKPSEFPDDGLPEVAIMGRSNVGKSSVINVLVGRKNLARTSSTPGKTRRIHFFQVEGAMYLVDLPGFGWARVGRQERAAWQPMVESYLRGTREALRGAILLIDLRRGPGDEERSLLDWLHHEGIPARVAWTKSDKLKPGKAAQQARAFATELGLEPGQSAAVSSLRARGFAPLVGWLQEWTGVPFRRADGTPF
ncbi:MAG: YihA family ribosome biogenesis GTP-binding protein [Deltaproteobacteria bacterium]|nr:YihA family ribosome biogenesis GTP-binding protein [Deltaproteobacteria bacterium]MBW2416068.1 YihA family ribosome biogenesis GTP-binding protein [Deltaproteobacteria bacterium]